MFGFGLQSQRLGPRVGKTDRRRRVQTVDDEPFAHGGTEPSVEDLLNDPVIRAVMWRDDVSPATLRALLDTIRPKLQERQACLAVEDLP